jgi:pentatricopeptide repeat protein
MDSFKPDTCTFNTLMDTHCRAGRIQDAKKVQMMEIRVRRDSASYSIVTRALCENGEFGRAEELVDSLLEEEVLKKRGGCVPLIASYNPVFKYLCENGKAKKARLLFGQLLDIRRKVDFLAFKTLILGHCKEEDFEEGYELVLSNSGLTSVSCNRWLYAEGEDEICLGSASQDVKQWSST